MVLHALWEGVDGLERLPLHTDQARRMSRPGAVRWGLVKVRRFQNDWLVACHGHLCVCLCAHAHVCVRALVSEQHLPLPW